MHLTGTAVSFYDLFELMAMNIENSMISIAIACELGRYGIRLELNSSLGSDFVYWFTKVFPWFNVNLFCQTKKNFEQNICSKKCFILVPKHIHP